MLEIDLLTAGGLAVILTLITQIALKPYLQRRYPEDETGQRDPLYSLVVNGATFVLALILATVGQIPAWAGVETVLEIIKLSVVATATAIGVYEIGSNTLSTRT